MKVGQLLAGRYRLEELVGEGGMSSVYRAHDTVLERGVAVKILHEHHARDPEHVERFRREARAIARLTHPNIVTVIDRGEFEASQFIVFEDVRGATLKQLIEREAPLPVERALVLAHQIARALAFAHEAGIVHRDVKPQNVLLDADGAAKVADFGIARSLDLEDSLTETGTLLGTSDYLAPEQASGERAEEPSDQYSLGAVLYELLTGEVPYPGENVMAVAMAHLRDPVPSVREKRPQVPPRVDAIVARALAKRPRDRFPSMEALAAALEACLLEERAPRRQDKEDTAALEPVPPVQPPAPRLRPRRSGVRPRLAVAALVLLAAGALVVGLLLAEMGEQEEGGGAVGASVRLSALRDFDPEGGDGEHPEDVASATDGDPATFWRTETYQDFGKSGVGIVLDAGRPVELGRLVLVSDTPGFTARIRAGSRAGGPFDSDVSEEQEVGPRATFELDTSGEPYRYYLVWITDPNGNAHVNEVRAP